MNQLLEFLKQLPEPWNFHIMARFTGTHSDGAPRGWWELEVRLTPRPANPSGSDVSTTLFRWSPFPTLDEMAEAMIPEIAKVIA